MRLRPIAEIVYQKPKPGDIVSDATGVEYTIKSIGCRYAHIVDPSGKEMIHNCRDIYIVRTLEDVVKKTLRKTLAAQEKPAVAVATPPTDLVEVEEEDVPTDPLAKRVEELKGKIAAALVQPTGEVDND